jgi:hypothetical protein
MIVLRLVGLRPFFTRSSHEHVMGSTSLHEEYTAVQPQPSAPSISLKELMDL